MNYAKSKGRSDKTPSYVGLPKYLIKSPAYKALSSYAKALYVEILFFYNGNNNGEIYMSVRKAAEQLVCAPNTASKALKDLVAKGFIKPKTKGSFTFKQRHATEWIITLHEYNNKLPTKEFATWVPEKNTVSKNDKTVSKFNTDRKDVGKK